MKYVLAALSALVAIYAVAMTPPDTPPGKPGTGESRKPRPSWMEAKESGKPVNCIPLTAIRQTQVRNDRTIDFEMRDGRVMRNTLPHGCPQLGFEEKFSYSTSLSQLCSTDIITVLISPGTSRGASCGLGQFQEVTLPEK